MSRQWREGRFKIGEAQAQGINVQDVVESWTKHLLDEMKANREKGLRGAPLTNIQLKVAVEQRSTASGVTWKSLGGLPEGVETITVTASTLEATKNKVSLNHLLDMRFKRVLGEEMIRAGLFRQDLEGRRAAMAKAIDAEIFIADFDFKI